MKSGIEIYDTAPFVLLTEVFRCDPQGFIIPLEIKQIKLCMDSLFAVGGINVENRELLMIRTWNGLSKKSIFLQQCHRAADRLE